MLTDLLFRLNLSWLLLGAIATLSIYWLWTKTRRPYLKYNIPPFPVSPLPIFGHFFMIDTSLRNQIKRWRDKVGDIFSLDFGGELHIVVNGYDNIKEVLVKNADHVPNTQRMFFVELINEYDKGLFTARDDNWKEQRAVSLSILRDFGMGKNVLAQKIQEEVSVYIGKLAALKGRPDDIKLLTNISVSNIICSIIVGQRFEHDDPYFVRFMELNDFTAKCFNKLVVINAFPFLYRLPGDMFSAHKCIDSLKEVRKMFAEKYIRKVKETYNENEEPTNFITAYLQEIGRRKGQGKATKLDEENLIVIIRFLFTAGTDTTSTTILWCVLYMLHHPQVQEKVYREIEEHVGIERIPNISDKVKLKYLNAVIMETQRMASLVPIAFRRECSNQFEVGGYTFPKDSIVWPNLDSVLFDKKIWGDPENFRPERFLDSNGALLKPEELIPFSTGRRMCLGKGLAQMELFIFLSNMFQRFKFEPADRSGKLPSTEGIFGGICLPHQFQVRIIDRRK